MYRNMNTLVLAAGLLALFATACKKESFDYKPYQPAVTDIDSIYFSTGANSLLADGRATLQFVVETYRTLQITTAAGSKKDSLVFVDYKNLPEGSLKIFGPDGKEMGMTYSTNSVAPGTASFYAQVGNKKSKTQTVQLKNKQVVPQKLFVDVVFHVFELNPTDPTYDQLTYQPVTQPLLEAAIADVNNVFNNVLGSDPNGGSANIEFRLAVKNPAGNTLANPGFDKIVYDKSWRQSATFYSPTDFTKKVNATASYTWDPVKYLNIYVIPSGANNSMGNNRPKYQMVPPGGQAIPGIPTILNSASELPTNANYETYGLGVPRTLLFPGTDRRIELSPFLGYYYGLEKTGVSSVTATDYCDDTRKYLSADQYSSLVKVGTDGNKFIANNAMDDNRYPSLRNSFTVGQVQRIRSIMAQSPNRMHGHP